MPDRVAIVGVGQTQFRATSPGVSYFDEYVPDQIGAALRPVHTIGSDGLKGLAAAYMQILTGAFDVVAVQT
jgi:acetyl-CoA C-acetyltransferase